MFLPVPVCVHAVAPLRFNQSRQNTHPTRLHHTGVPFFTIQCSCILSVWQYGIFCFSAVSSNPSHAAMIDHNIYCRSKSHKYLAMYTIAEACRSIISFLKYLKAVQCWDACVAKERLENQRSGHIGVLYVRLEPPGGGGCPLEAKIGGRISGYRYGNDKR